MRIPCCFRYAAMTRARRPDSGYALLAVLWIMVGIGGLTVVITAAARTAIASTRNRIAITTASWTASGCLGQARDVVTMALASRLNQPGSAERAWNFVDRTVQTAPFLHDSPCRLTTRAVGARLDVNANDAPTVAMVLLNAGMRAGQADSVAAVIASNRPFVDLRQLRTLPALQSLEVLDSVLDVESGPVSLNHASRAVLAALPGFTDETARQVLDARNRGTPIPGFHELKPLLSPASPGASARLPGVAVFEPVAWLITVRASAGTPVVTAVLEARLIRSESGTTIERQRRWLE